MLIGDVVKLKMTTSPNIEFSQFKEAFNMGMTMTQKILAAHAGLDSVEACGMAYSRRHRFCR